MKTLQINTTQNVAVNFELANVGQRLTAFIIDNIVKIAYIYFMFYTLKLERIIDTISDDNWSGVALIALITLPVTTYTLYSEILMNGQTLGKKIMKIQVLNIDGFKPSITDYIMRWFLRIVDFNFFIIIVIYYNALGGSSYIGYIYYIWFLGKLVGFFFILITKINQRVGDISANTIVVCLKDKADISHTILEEISEVYDPTYPDVINLSDNDLRIIKELFETAKGKNDYKTLVQLREKIIDVTGITKKNETDVDFITTVLKDYNYYTQDM